MAEVGRAVTAQGLDVGQANALVSALLEKYEHLFARGAAENPGSSFDEIYDLETIRPTPAWQETYEEAKRAMRGLGLAAL
jgi:hypothetical protein